MIKNILNQKWELGFLDRFHGHGDFGVICWINKRKQKQELIVGSISKKLAEHIIKIHNDYLLIRRARKKKFGVMVIELKNNKVKELMKALSEMNPESEVRLTTNQEIKVVKQDRPDQVYLEASDPEFE